MRRSPKTPQVEIIAADKNDLTAPMDKPKLTKTRIILAFGIAIIADLIQLPITAVEATGMFSMPGELADLLVDCVVMAATTALLGFHWALLPTLVVEVIPGLDLLPTWTGCVAYVVWRRKKEQSRPPPLRPVVEVQEVEITSPPPPHDNLLKDAPDNPAGRCK
jgi:hypothetical protein